MTMWKTVHTQSSKYLTFLPHNLLKDSLESHIFLSNVCSALSWPPAFMPELPVVWININCSASRVLYYRSGLFSINQQLKGDCLGLHRFSSRPLCVYCDLLVQVWFIYYLWSGKYWPVENVGQVDEKENKNYTRLEVMVWQLFINSIPVIVEGHILLN